MHSTPDGLTPGRVLLLATACCIVVANIYFNQSVLSLIAAAFPRDRDMVSLVPMATQLGYTAGLFFLIPLGDYINRQHLILRQVQGLCLSLAGMVLSPGAGWLVMFSFLTGMMATVAQQIVPLVAALSPEASRGRAVGSVMSGVLAGILVGRAIGGVIGQYFSWRGVFLCGGLMTLLAIVLMSRILPRQSYTAPVFCYPALLRSLRQLWCSEPGVRVATLMQAALFASFSLLWTVLPFWLQQRYHYGAGITGAFAVLGLAGILCAPLAGSCSDRCGPVRVIAFGTLLMATAWGVFLCLDCPAGMVIGILLLDAGEQCALIANQHIIYSLRPDARNRLNTLFMSGMFLGGAGGSVTATRLWEHGNDWQVITLTGLGMVLLATAILLSVRYFDSQSRG